MTQKEVTLKEFIEEKLNHLNDNINGKFESINVRIDNVIERQDIANGRTAKNEEEIRCVKRDTWWARYIGRNPGVSIGVFVVAVLLIFFLYTKFGIEPIINILK